MALVKLVAILELLMFSRPILGIQKYGYKLDVGDAEDLCPAANFTCSEKKIHFLCEEPIWEPKCVCYDRKVLTGDEIRSLQRSVNGLRNKVSRQFKITNMNLVYWSDDLSKMSRLYLLTCAKYPDTCLTIGDKALKVSQNKGNSSTELSYRWTGRVVRSWYMELGSNITDWNGLKSKLYSGEAKRLSNMIYPLVEFMGCSIAQINESIMVVCYFHPPFNIYSIESDFKIGATACSECDSIRPDCSKSFSSLCGVDFDYKESSKSANLYLNIFALIVFLLHDL